ncbi:hypothetical protein BDAP_002543 [Binucleata daphniae]
MYIFAGLPIDTPLEEAHLLSFIRKNLSQSEILNIPMFPVQHLDSLLESGDFLQETDDSLQQTMKTFFTYTKSEATINAQSVDYAIKTFKWSTTKYEPVCIKIIIDRIRSDVDNFKLVFANRVDLYEKALKQVEIANKALNGSIKDVDVESVEHEFLIEHFVIVNKNRIKEFDKLLESCDKVIINTKTVVLSEKDTLLFKVYGLKSAAEEVKKLIAGKGFVYKNSYNQKEFEERRTKNLNAINDCEIVKNNFQIFINTNISEIFSLFMHVKVVKLYVECVLLYGVKSCVYFVCVGKKSKILHKWKEIVSNWRFSKRLQKNNELNGYLLVSDPTKKDDTED